MGACWLRLKPCFNANNRVVGDNSHIRVREHSVHEIRHKNDIIDNDVFLTKNIMQFTKELRTKLMRFLLPPPSKKE